MILVAFTPQFVKKFNNLERDLQIEVKEKVELFKNPNNHKQLKVHRLHGPLSGRYAFSVNYKVRIVFQFKDKQTIQCLNIGDHEIYKN